MLTIADVYNIIDRFAPFDLAEEFDNSGIFLGSMGEPVEGILLSLDVTRNIVVEARARGASLVLSHHPVVLEPIRQINTETLVGGIVRAAFECGVSIVSAHTNMDSARGGINDVLADKIGLTRTKPLLPHPRYKDLGLGRIGVLRRRMKADEFIGYLKEVCGIETVRAAGPINRYIKRVALCSGSGGRLYRSAMQAGAECYISGDMKHGMGLEADEHGMVVVDVSHHATEVIFVDIMEMLLTKALKAHRKSVRILKSERLTDPFQFV